FDFQSVLWEDNGQYYFVRHPEETFDLGKLDKIPIPAEHLCPAWHPCLPVALDPIPEDSYVKPPNVIYYQGDDRIAKYLLGEADILSRLEQGQHPNIGRFRGCIVTDDGLINGLCLKLYPRTLADSIRRRVDDLTSSEHLEGLDHANILRGIVEGVKFIHSLGLVHNDLNPRNIMLDESNNPIIIDFDSCKLVGTSMKG
ncbi:kinase-like domain-containing protein, partial [Gautieria morchelliformis]